MPPTLTPSDRNPEILSEKGSALVLPFAVDRPDEDFEQPAVASEEIPASIQVGVTSTATEVAVEPVVDPDASEKVRPPVRTLTSGHMSIMSPSMYPPKRRKKSGGGGSWWYVRRYLKLQGLYDPDED
jgi:hypothetical protein